MTYTTTVLRKDGPPILPAHQRAADVLEAAEALAAGETVEGLEEWRRELANAMRAREPRRERRVSVSLSQGELERIRATARAELGRPLTDAASVRVLALAAVDAIARADAAERVEAARERIRARRESGRSRDRPTAE